MRCLGFLRIMDVRVQGLWGFGISFFFFGFVHDKSRGRGGGSAAPPPPHLRNVALLEEWHLLPRIRWLSDKIRVRV